MGDVVGRNGIVVPDDPTEAATFRPGRFDKLDLTAYNGDVLVQFLKPDGVTWAPREGLPQRRGQFTSWPGLTELYPPGPDGVRFTRLTRGVPATVDFKAWTV